MTDETRCPACATPVPHGHDLCGYCSQQACIFAGCTIPANFGLDPINEDDADEPQQFVCWDHGQLEWAVRKGIDTAVHAIEQGTYR